MTLTSLLIALAAAQVSLADQALPGVRLCTAQGGGLERARGVQRPDGIYWWPRSGAAVRFDPAQEVTARQRDWFREERDLVIDGQTWRYGGQTRLDDMPFRRYNLPHARSTAFPPSRRWEMRACRFWFCSTRSTACSPNGPVNPAETTEPCRS